MEDLTHESSLKCNEIMEDPACLPENPQRITFEDVTSASYIVKSGIANTPCIKSHLSDTTGVEIFLKKDFLQFSGSFKERGARNALLMLSNEKKSSGVISASLGNHAQALSYHGMKLNIPVTVIMPIVAPIMKVQKCRNYNANVIVHGKDMSEAKKYAMKVARENGLTYINGYDHPHIMAGQGTIGLEIIDDVPNIDAVLIPVGGGGLIAGVATVIKSLSPNTKIIGVESERCASFSKALAAGKPVYVPIEATLADGLAVPIVGYNAFETARHLVDKVVIVKEELLAISILALVEQEKCVVEGAGAAGLAAILSGELPELTGKRVVVILSGGNIDTTILGRCLERGLAVLGRLLKFQVQVSDRPGGIAELTHRMHSIGVSIKDIMHERAWVSSDVFSVQVKVICETRDIEHAIQLKELLESHYKKVDFSHFPDIHTAKALGI